MSKSVRSSTRACGNGVAVLVAMLAMALADPASAEPTRVHRYTVAVDEELSAIQVRACFAGKAPRQLMAESLDAAAALESAVVQGGKKRFEPNGAELRLGSLPDDSCVAYTVNLTLFNGRHEHGGSPTRHVGGDLITDLGMWFWRPDTLKPDEDIEVVFDLPPGLSASAPWQLIDAPDGGQTYRVGHGPFDWPAAVAFGHFTERIVEAPGVRLRVAVLDGRPKVDEAQIAAWLQRAASAVTTLYGRFPVPTAQVLVIPGARGNEPVPWAYVLRGGGPSAHIFINQRRPMEEFDLDWSVVHELSHLLLPYVQSEDAWLSEGTASYYQNVLRARAGMIGANEAWKRMHGGFKRGMERVAGVTLADATERMYRNGAFMRVYWEGAAIMLLADQRLRARTQGRQSLDTALDQLQRCCLSGEVGWRGRDLFGKLDELTGTTVFSELYQQHVGSDNFPDIAAAYDVLGLRVTGGGNVVLLDDAAQRADRDAIMSETHGVGEIGTAPERAATPPSDSN
jgi:hypothetical protein